MLPTRPSRATPLRRPRTRLRRPPPGRPRRPQRPASRLFPRTDLIRELERHARTAGPSYGHACGQRHVSRLQARELTKHFADSILNVADLRGTLWATLLEGARNPGRLARRYVEGERERFINPISYILLATALLFLFYGLFRPELVQAMAEMSRAQWEAMGMNNPEEQFFGPDGIYRKAFGLSSVEAYAQKLVTILQQAQTYFLLVYGMLGAGILRLVLSSHTFAELVVFELYAMAQTVLFQIVLLPIFVATSLLFWIVLGIPLQLGVLALAGYGFFDDGWKGALLPPLAHILVYLVVIPAISAVVGVGIGIAIS